VRHSDCRTSNKRTQGLICVGTVGNAVPILILEWERRSVPKQPHLLLSCCGDAFPTRSHTSHFLVVTGVTFYATVVSCHNHFCCNSHQHFLKCNLKILCRDCRQHFQAKLRPTPAVGPSGPRLQPYGPCLFTSISSPLLVAELRPC